MAKEDYKAEMRRLIDIMTTMTYDDRSYHIPYTFAMENLPDEDVYKPKNKKPEEKKKAGLEHFMDEGETDAVRGYD